MLYSIILHIIIIIGWFGKNGFAFDTEGVLHVEPFWATMSQTRTMQKKKQHQCELEEYVTSK